MSSAGGYLRTMDNQRDFSDATVSSGRHVVGEVLSGALWEMRKSLGKEKFDPLLAKAWAGIVKTDEAAGQIPRFFQSLKMVIDKESTDPDDGLIIRSISQRRGLELPW